MDYNVEDFDYNEEYNDYKEDNEEGYDRYGGLPAELFLPDDDDDEYDDDDDIVLTEDEIAFYKRMDALHEQAEWKARVRDQERELGLAPEFDSFEEYCAYYNLTPLDKWWDNVLSKYGEHM